MFGLGILLLLVVLVGSAHSAGAAGSIYYVAKSGNDSNPGTDARPFLTLAKGVTALKPGDTLLVRAGTYTEELPNTIPSGVSWEEPVTIRAFPGDTVILKPGTGAERVLYFRRGAQYIVVDGFVMDGSSILYQGVKFDDNVGEASPHHIRIMNSEVMNSPAQGIYIDANVEYIELINLVVHDNGQTDFHHGVYIQGSHNLIEGGSYYRNAGWGIHIYGGPCNANIVRNIKSYDNARVGDRGVGIGVYNGKGNIVYNNLVWGNKKGIVIDYGASDTRVLNNTVYNNVEFGLQNGGESTGALIMNNIVFQARGRLLVDDGDDTILKTNLTSDPLFVNAAALNFHLRPESAAIDAGAPAVEVLFDFDGIPRPQGRTYDIGAFEYSPQPIATRAATAQPTP